MTIRRQFRLSEKTRHKNPMGIVAAAALALMLGSLAACGQGSQQDQGTQQQDQFGEQTDHQFEQPGQKDRQQDRTQDMR